MKTFQALKSLGLIDALSVIRDPLLRAMLLAPLLIGPVVRVGIEPLTLELLKIFHFDLTPYYPLTASLFLLLLPILFGMVVGFLLLDQRDDGTLPALQVTPLTLYGYFVYRISVPMVLSLLTIVALIPITGLVELGIIPFLVSCITAAPLAPLFALFIAAFAQNKVQGFAVVKASGGLQILPLLSYFVTTPWQVVFGIVPTYWPAKVFWLAEAGNPMYGFYAVVGILYQSLLIVLLFRRFDRIAHR